jgi:hypothetical protein
MHRDDGANETDLLEGKFQGTSIAANRGEWSAVRLNHRTGLESLYLQERIQMPAKSKAQQMAAGAALAAKRGEKPESELKGASRSMYDSMDQRQLEDFASTKQKGKPTHKSKSG